MQEEWSRKGATLSDKTARKEFGLTQDEIVAAIDAGQLQYRVGVIHGNPWLRLLRREVEELMDSTFTDRDHRHRRGDGRPRHSAEKEARKSSNSFFCWCSTAWSFLTSAWYFSISLSWASNLSR